MGQTPDHRPGVPSYEDLQTIYTDVASAYPTVAGGQAYGNGVFRMQDAAGTYDPRVVYQLTHTALLDLAHFIDGPCITGAYLTKAYVTGTPFLSTATWWTSSAQTARLLDLTLSYPSGNYSTVSTAQYRVYASDGATVLHQALDKFTYSGVLEINRTRTYT
jgi:hypothetical protein